MAGKDTASELLGVLFWLGVAGWIIVSFCSPEDWSIRYSFRYFISMDHVHIDGRRSTECDWMRSPLGDKACHYERTVFKTLTLKGANGETIYSNDEGKTWSDGAYHQSNNNTTTDIFVSWQKKEDP